MTADVTTFCPHCHAPVQPGDRFCEECAGALVADAEAAAPAVVSGAPQPGEEIGGLGGASEVLQRALDEQREEAAAAASGRPRRAGVTVLDPDLTVVPTRCSACPGQIAADGYCEECGTPAVKPRDHWIEQPAPWVAMVCDRGQRHAINQDAAAIGAASAPGSFAALVICDGVSSAARSEVASLAAARAARDVLVAPPPAAPDVAEAAAAVDVPTTPANDPDATVPIPIQTAQPPSPPSPPSPPAVKVTEPNEPAASEQASADPSAADQPADQPPADQAPADQAPPAIPAERPSARAEGEFGSTATPSQYAELAKVMKAAGAAAQAEALAAASDPPEYNPPACTFVAAVLDGPIAVIGWVGDSRAYWMPDDGIPVQLSVDDSWAAEAIAWGFSRHDAERAPQAHSITRWLGHDAPDPVPRMVGRRLGDPGWLLLCSDGLWNYCSEAADLHDLVLRTAAEVQQDCLTMASTLVDWANQQGGHDNISVALARIG